MQQLLQEQQNNHITRCKQQPKKAQILRPPRTHKSDCDLKACTPTDDNKSVFTHHDDKQRKFDHCLQESESSNGSFVTIHRFDGVDERSVHAGALGAICRYNRVDERLLQDLGNNKYCFDCYLKEVANPSHEQYLDRKQDDGGSSDGGLSH